MHECSAGASPVTRPGRRARELGGLPTPAFAGARGRRRLSTAQSRLIAIGRRSLCSIVDYFPSRTRHQLPWPVSETLPEHLEWAAVGVRTPGGQEGCSSCCRRSGILAKTSLSLPTNYAALLPLITCMLTKRKLPRRPFRVPGSPGRRRNRLRGQFVVVRRPCSALLDVSASSASARRARPAIHHHLHDSSSSLRKTPTHAQKETRQSARTHAGEKNNRKQCV